MQIHLQGLKKIHIQEFIQSCTLQHTGAIFRAQNMSFNDFYMRESTALGFVDLIESTMRCGEFSLAALTI